jgi:hypothetical protein
VRRKLAIAVLITGIVGVGADLWVRKTFGVFLPWQIPERIDVCGRRYHPPVPLTNLSSDVVVVRIHATVLALPIPLPDLAPIRSSLPYAGCPIQLQLVVGDRVIAYGPPEGGP